MYQVIPEDDAIFRHLKSVPSLGFVGKNKPLVKHRTLINTVRYTYFHLII